MKVHFILIFLFIFFIQAHAQLTRIPIQKLSKQTSSSSNTKFLHLQASQNPIKNIANYWSIEYVGLIKLGSEKKEFRVLLDTGSAPLWLPDAHVKNLSAGHNTYNCSESKTCTASPSVIKNITYGQGSILGYPIIDDIQIGDIVIPQYNLLLADVIHKIPNNFYDGIMGLSLGRWQNLSTFPTLLETLKNAGTIKDAMFSMYLGNEPTAVGNMTGELIFGGYDPKYADSEFTFITVDDGNRTQHWMANMTGLGFGAVNVSDITNIPVIFDSGGSLNVFPQTFLDNIMNQSALLGFNFTYNNLTNNYYCDCKAQKALPDLFFYFENSTFNLKASSYILSDGMFCYLGFIALKAPIDNVHHCAVLGDVFLKDYYAIYSLDNNTVGLAKARKIGEDFNQWKIIIPLAFVLIIVLACVCIQMTKKKETTTNESHFLQPQEQEEATM